MGKYPTSTEWKSFDFLLVATKCCEQPEAIRWVVAVGATLELGSLAALRCVDRSTVVEAIQLWFDLPVIVRRVVLLLTRVESPDLAVYVDRLAQIEIGGAA